MKIILFGICSSVLSFIFIHLYEKYFTSIKKLYEINLGNVRYCESILNSKKKEKNKPKNQFIFHGYSFYNTLDSDCYKLSSPKYIQKNISSVHWDVEKINNNLDVQKNLLYSDLLIQKYERYTNMKREGKIKYYDQIGKLEYDIGSHYDDPFYVLIIEDYLFNNTIIQGKRLSKKN